MTYIHNIKAKIVKTFNNFVQSDELNLENLFDLRHSQSIIHCNNT